MSRHACLRRTRAPRLRPSPVPGLRPLLIPLCPLDGRPMDPCGAATEAGGAGVTRTRHQMGRTSGTVTLTYQMQTIPDQLDVYDASGNLLATTGGPVSGAGVLTFAWSAPTGIELPWVLVVVTGPSGTVWSYTIGCPVP
jgi:hypothetical protein